MTHRWLVGGVQWVRRGVGHRADLRQLALLPVNGLVVLLVHPCVAETVEHCLRLELITSRFLDLLFE